MSVTPNYSAEGMREIAGGLAHDLNNQLGVILNCSWLLARQVSGEAAEVNVRDIRIAAEQAVELAHRLQDLADPAGSGRHIQ